MLNVKYIKLLNGEELVSTVLFSEDNKLVLKNPIRIVIMPGKDQKTPSIGLAPWLEFTDDKEVSIDKSHVLAIMTPIQEMINQYNSIFGGILAPSSKLILPQ